MFVTSGYCAVDGAWDWPCFRDSWILNLGTLATLLFPYLFFFHICLIFSDTLVWSKTSEISSEFGDHATVAVNGQLLLIGGCKGTTYNRHILKGTPISPDFQLTSF